MEKSMSLWNTLVPGRRLCWIIGMLQAFRRMLREAWKESVKLFLFVLKWLCFLLDYFLWPFRVLPSLYFSLNLLTIFKIVQRHLVCIIHAEPLLPKLLTHLLLTWPFPIKPCNVTVLSAPVHPSLPVPGSSRESVNLCIGKTFCSVLLFVSMHLSVSEWVWPCKGPTAYMEVRGAPQMPDIAFHLVWNAIPLLFSLYSRLPLRLLRALPFSASHLALGVLGLEIHSIIATFTQVPGIRI